MWESSTALSQAVFITCGYFGIRRHLTMEIHTYPQRKTLEEKCNVLMWMALWDFHMFTLGDIQFVLKDLHWFCLHLSSVPFLLQPFYNTSTLHGLMPENKIFYVNFFYKNSIKNFHGFSVRRRFCRYEEGLTLLPLDFLKVSAAHALWEPFPHKTLTQVKTHFFFQLKFVGNLKLFGSNQINKVRKRKEKKHKMN